MKQTAATLVSVVVTNYNYARFVDSAIESVLDQTYRPIEVIVVDDGSTDGSGGVIRGFGDRVRAVFGEHRGFAAAVNTGAGVASGSVICFLDADDRFLPRKVERVVRLLGAEPGAAACFHARIVEWPDGRTRAVALGADGLTDERQALRRGRPLFVATTTSGLAFRREALSQILPLPESDGIGVSDHALKFGALAVGPVLFADEPLSVQRVHGANLYTETGSAADAAVVLLRNAVWLDAKFPDLSRLADTLVLNALALMPSPTTLQRELLAHFLRRRPWLARFRLANRHRYSTRYRMLPLMRPTRKPS